MSRLVTPAELSSARVAIPAWDFVTRWVEYGTSRTHAPREFHHSVGLAMVSAAIARHRWLPLQHKPIYPALFLLNLAPSGFVKSIPLIYGKSVLRHVVKGQVLADDYSPQALIKDLSGRKPSHGVALIDEAGRLFQTMQKKGFGEALKDIFSELWDCPDTSDRKLMDASFLMTEVYITLVMSTTITRFQETTTPEDISSGFLARFLPTVVTEKPIHKPLSLENNETVVALAGLTKDLLEIYMRLAKTPGPIKITSEALARLDQGDQAVKAWADREFEAELIGPWAQRLAENLGRLAIIFAVSEQAETVSIQHVRRALGVIDRAKDDVRTLVEELTKDRLAKQLDKVSRFIQQNPGLSTRELYRRMQLATSEGKSCIQELLNQERIRLETIPGANGKDVQHVYPVQISQPARKTDVSTPQSPSSNGVTPSHVTTVTDSSSEVRGADSPPGPMGHCDAVTVVTLPAGEPDEDDYISEGTWDPAWDAAAEAAAERALFESHLEALGEDPDPTPEVDL